MNIIIAPIHETFFVGRGWMGLDIEDIKEKLELINSNYKVSIIDFFDVVNNITSIPQNSLLFYSSSKNSNYLNYIKDCVFNFSKSRKDVVLLPNLDQLFSYENKGYQELVRRRLNIANLDGEYFGDIEDYLNKPDRRKPPFVFKTIDGAGSVGVKLIKEENDLDKLFKVNKITTLIEQLRKYINIEYRLKKDYSGYAPSKKYASLNFHKFRSKRKNFIVQNFIPDLKSDFKILIFGTKFYALKRVVRKNDFRASASGNFQWVNPPIEILNYAHKLQQIMGVPFIGLDIGIDKNNETFLFEFEGIGFGPLTLTNSEYFYVKNEDTWDKIENTSSLEEEYANAINYHIINNL